MWNRLMLGLKSAVIFTTILALNGCDKLNSPTSSQTPSSPSVVTEMQNFPPKPTYGRDKLTRAMASPMVLDPWQVTEAEQTSLIRDLFEGLTAYDAQGNIVPGAAESWQTKDNKHWMFILREGLRWSNGALLTAQDFVLSWQALSQSESPLKSYLLYLNLKEAKAVLEKKLPLKDLGIKAENDRTLLITLDKPTPYLPEMLAHIALLPQYRDADLWVSNGAYSLLFRDETGIQLIKNPYYWNKNAVSFKKVDYVPYNGKPLSEFDILLATHPKSENTRYFPQLCGYFYEFNLHDAQLKNPLVRKAIASLISVTAITNNEMPHAIPSSYFLPKAMLHGQDSRWEPVVAEQLLAKTPITEKKPLTLKIIYDNVPLHRNIAQRLARQLSESDLLRIETSEMSWQALQEKRIKGEFQLIRSGWCGDFNHPMAFLGLFYSKSPDNKSGYTNAKYDQLFEQALKSVSKKERSEIYLKLSEIIQQENLVLPLFQYTTPVYIAPSVMGAQKNPIGAIYSKDLWRKVEIAQ
ncbi:hypothetical protein BKK52_04090 [Rodentibacter trehalosifermentans]|uniref:Solute-binding protein family 5 domain-containing protein n=1 Tax=Rodentibacter trehalosifermentans TaxID=1908263 RepID=A0A1V3J2S6_9PAST|nr:peptide ABC transporter substrate-binding protein [Rodentibacter trehalosifermentans]OOF49226.1 hypothetical protein BKK52_04090 [Rodentibacter trehalosifermentans]